MSIRRVLSACDATNCTVWRWRELRSAPGFRRVLAAVQDGYRRCPCFEDELLELVRSRQVRLPIDHICHDERAAVQYVVQELAAMVYLMERASPSWSIQVFPSPMPAMLRRCYESPLSEQLALHKDISGYVEISILDGAEGEDAPQEVCFENFE